MASSYDVVVIGAGPGGYVAAIRAAQRGARTALVEKELLGGVCLNWGCIPTKTLMAAAETLRTCRDSGEFGVQIDGEIGVDWDAMRARKNRVTQDLRKGIQALLKSNGVDVFQGTARYRSRLAIEVIGADGEKHVLETKRSIIATGSIPVRPPFLPDEPTILDSRALLDAPQVPERLLVLGGGVIGCEFAALFAALGAKVTILEMLPDILPGVDSELTKTLRREFKKQGIDVQTDTRVDEVQAGKDGVRARAGDIWFEGDLMLVSVGRRPNLEGLGIDSFGLSTKEDGSLAVNRRCRTRAPGVYAIGDATGAPYLAHRASAMGVCAAENAVGNDTEYEDLGVPSCIFTHPEIACVGMTEEEARKENREIRIGRFPFLALGKARAIARTEGMVKIVADAESDQVLGVHIIGPHATDLAGEAALAVRLEATAAELASTIHAHPTLPEAIMEAAHDVHGLCIHLPRPKKKDA